LERYEVRKPDNSDHPGKDNLEHLSCDDITLHSGRERSSKVFERKLKGAHPQSGGKRSVFKQGRRARREEGSWPGAEEKRVVKSGKRGITCWVTGEKRARGRKVQNDGRLPLDEVRTGGEPGEKNCPPEIVAQGAIQPCNQASLRNNPVMKIGKGSDKKYRRKTEKRKGGCKRRAGSQNAPGRTRKAS